MKIGIDACCLANKRGYGRFTKELLQAILKNDHHNQYILFCDLETSTILDLEGDYRKVVVKIGKEVNQAAGANSYRAPLDLLRMTKAVLQEDLDWFYFPSTYSFFPIANRCKVAITIHDTIAENYPQLIFPTRRDRLFWQAKVWLACRQANIVFTVSQFARNSIEKVFSIPREKIHILLEAPAQFFAQHADIAANPAVINKVGLQDNDPFYLYVGGINPHKNLQLLIKAFSDKAFSQSKLILVGDYQNDRFFSDFETLHSLIRERGLTEQVIFTGYLTDLELATLYKCALAIILPSFYEGFGLPAIEAMVSGVPAIVTLNSAIPEIAPDGALYFAPEDGEGLKNAMYSLLTDSSLRKQIAEKGSAYAKKLSWDTTAQTFLQVLANK